MSNPAPKSQFKDIEDVSKRMKQLVAHTEENQEKTILAGMGSLTIVYDAISILADEIEELKARKE